MLCSVYTSTYNMIVWFSCWFVIKFHYIHDPCTHSIDFELPTPCIYTKNIITGLTESVHLFFRFKNYLPLHDLWKDYMRDILDIKRYLYKDIKMFYLSAEMCWLEFKLIRPFRLQKSSLMTNGDLKWVKLISISKWVKLISI